MKKFIAASILGLVVLAGCHSTSPTQKVITFPGFPSLATPVSGRGALAIRVVLGGDSGYTVLATPKILGDILTSASFTIDGPNVPAPVTKTVTRAQWLNPDGSYKTITTSFIDVLPGEVTITVSGIGSSNNVKIIGGAATASVEADSITAATVVARYVKGEVQIGLDPNTVVSPIK